MNETITLRPESRASTKDVIIDYMLASVDEVEQLQPALNLLAQPSAARGGHDFVHCYEAGTQNKALKQNRHYLMRYFGTPRRDAKKWAAVCRSGSPERPGPAADAQSSVRSGRSVCASVADADAETRSGFYTVRSISLPVYRRLLRDKHPSGICLQQALLHLLAWKSDSPGRGSRLKRLLWQGGVLGIKASLR
jgi:triphosphoribosyl-dephospho-CoA synthetase